MPVDNKIKDENLEYDFKQKEHKYRHYHQVKLINVTVLLLFYQRRVTEQFKFSYSPQRKIWKNKQKRLKIKDKSK